MTSTVAFYQQRQLDQHDSKPSKPLINGWEKACVADCWGLQLTHWAGGCLEIGQTCGYSPRQKKCLARKVEAFSLYVYYILLHTLYIYIHICILCFTCVASYIYIYINNISWQLPSTQNIVISTQSYKIIHIYFHMYIYIHIHDIYIQYAYIYSMHIYIQYAYIYIVCIYIYIYIYKYINICLYNICVSDTYTYYIRILFHVQLPPK